MTLLKKTLVMSMLVMVFPVYLLVGLAFIIAEWLFSGWET